MKRDGERVLVETPELLKDEFGLGARVDEDEDRAVRADRLVDGGQRVARGMAGPGDAEFLAAFLDWRQHRDFRAGAGRRDNDFAQAFAV